MANISLRDLNPIWQYGHYWVTLYLKWCA